MPALSSSPIRPALEQLSDLPSRDLALVGGLRRDRAKDPGASACRPWHPGGAPDTLTSLLPAAVAAVLAVGAKSFTAVW